MKKIVLVSCVSKKNRGTHKAKYHLLDPEAIVEDYNKTLNTFSAADRKEWANVVLEQMSKVGINLEQDEMILSAGKNACQEQSE